MITQENLTRDKGAKFSACMVYRYRLWRRWGDGDMVNWICLNPSIADHLRDDPTVARLCHRSQELGYGGLFVTNLFAFRATDPKEMKAASDPIGRGNDAEIIAASWESALTVVAWGTHGKYMGRGEYVLELLAEADIVPHALKLSKDGMPSHPLYLPYSLKPVPLSC